jgi:TfoX/Sxy family transcriptional regulator of competence genes
MQACRATPLTGGRPMSIAADELADRIRAQIADRPGLTEKRMFGGVGFMLNGNMVVGAMRSGALLLRVGPDRHEEAMRLPGAQPMNHGGRSMVGFVEYTDEGIDTDEALAERIAFAWAFVSALPPK